LSCNDDEEEELCERGEREKERKKERKRERLKERKKEEGLRYFLPSQKSNPLNQHKRNEYLLNYIL
jgi:hypothetical protein